MTQLKLYTIAQGLEYAKDYCAKEERCQSQVMEKLMKYGLNLEESETCIAELICEGYINEQRYADLFAVSKFHQNKWGKLKISQALKLKQISSVCISNALNAIDYDEYLSLIKDLFDKKFASLSGQKRIREQKTISYLMSKGFSYSDIMESVKFNEDDF